MSNRRGHRRVSSNDIVAAILKEDIRDHYNFERMLGSGSYGSVFMAAQHKMPEKKYAVKVLRRWDYSADDIDKLRQELTIMVNTDSPHIVKFEEVFYDDKYINIVMEYIEGGEIFQKMQQAPKNRLPEEEAKLYISQSLKGLNHLHTKKIIHRDLKPENMMYDEALENVKLIDFGLSKMLGKRKNTDEFVGTPYYMAPEVFRGTYTTQCDLWSVGVITYRLLCGKYPFDVPRGGGLEHLERKVLTGEFLFEPEQVWDTISPEAKNFIKALLRLHPRQRLTCQ